jgi:hypothetical protein
VLVLAAIAYVLERRGQGASAKLLERGLLAVAVALGALLFAGTLAGEGDTSWWGIAAGAACALLGYLAVAALFMRARRRLTGGAAGLINAYADMVALALAGISIAVPALGYLALAAFVLLIGRTRAQAGGKYEGLRILR